MRCSLLRYRRTLNITKRIRKRVQYQSGLLTEKPFVRNRLKTQKSRPVVSVKPSNVRQSGDAEWTQLWVAVLCVCVCASLDTGTVRPPAPLHLKQHAADGRLYWEKHLSSWVIFGLPHTFAIYWKKHLHNDYKRRALLKHAICSLLNMLIAEWRSEWEQQTNAQYEIHITEYACKRSPFFLNHTYSSITTTIWKWRTVQDYDVNTCKTRLVWSVSGNTQSFLLEQVFIFIKITKEFSHTFFFFFFLRNTEISF